MEQIRAPIVVPLPLVRDETSYFGFFRVSKTALSAARCKRKLLRFRLAVDVLLSCVAHHMSQLNTKHSVELSYR